MCNPPEISPRPLAAAAPPPSETCAPPPSAIAVGTDWAAHNRQRFRHALVINLLASSGAGKTTLVQRLLQDSHLISGADPLHTHDLPVRAGVLMADAVSDRDVTRLQRYPGPVVTIAMGDRGCLDAASIAQAVQAIDLDDLNLLIIENGGNLTGAAHTDLGEDLRIVLMAVTEGETLPLRHAAAFESAHAVVISKLDQAEGLGFNHRQALHNLHLVAPHLLIFELSAITGQGLANFYAYLSQAIFQCRAKVGPA